MTAAEKLREAFRPAFEASPPEPRNVERLLSVLRDLPDDLFRIAAQEIFARSAEARLRKDGA